MTRQPWWPPKLYENYPPREWDHEMHLCAQEREESFALMDAAWRERIRKLHMDHWPVSDYSTDPSGLVHWFVEELLSGRDIE